MKDDAIIRQQEAFLKNSIINVETRLFADILNKFSKSYKNAYEENDLITKTDKNDNISELALVLMGFYGVLASWLGPQKIQDRIAKYKFTASWTLTKRAKRYIKDLSDKVAQGHVETIIADVRQMANDEALTGAPLEQIVSDIKKKYAAKVTETRAETIARSETNRAFTFTQYEADRQFVEQNGLEKRAYKKWTVRSDNPCPICIALSKEKAIPIDVPFRELGGTVDLPDDKTHEVTFETLESGNAHPNCSCTYTLIIRQ